ncbi:MAG: rhomboid family intramembrane serine protease [Lachnospiraceae bacterium]|nr:rhomboid family intramembrane serine protease [Lachnospiraceae bacterium]
MFPLYTVANLSHYINNMMMLLLAGPMLEEKYGSRLLLEMILITAFVTGIVNVMLFPTGLLGASGIVFMMIILSSVTSVKEGKIPLTLIVVVILYLGEQIAAGILSADNISQLTHIVGGVCGGIFGLLLQNKRNGSFDQ